MINIRFRDKTNTWPAFVDLFSNLVIILIFLLIVFVFLWTTTSVFNKSAGIKVVADLKKQNAEQVQTIAQMTADDTEAKQLLVMARGELEALESDRAALEDAARNMDMTIEELANAYDAKTAEMANYQTQIDALTGQVKEIQTQRSAQIAELNAQLTAAKTDGARVAELESAQTNLTTELARLNDALNAAEARAASQEVQYVEMSNRLNKALADKVAELNTADAYQSEFYRAIKTALGDRTTIRADGDRFIVSSDILFPSGAYALSDAGKEQLRLISGVIRDLEERIPTNINWIIRVDGHTDKKQVLRGTRGYSNNTQLSLLRATAVVNELVKNGVSRRRLLPGGFGDLYPVELGNDSAALQQNRRIELQLTNR